ncbi:MAG: ATP-binding cassette domain-containing protein [Candidatus Hodarchaeaceae archaeon]|nr:ATP-binding cassette domain-containing protein [Candidatus Hodarchaeaceae archaeon]
MATLEELRGVVKKYDGISALKGVDLDVREGEALTIVGPNGSGKTTLLRLMAFLDKPTSGEIFYKGMKIGDVNAGVLRGKVTMVFQRTALFDTTVYKNVAYGLELQGRPDGERRRRVGWALDLVGMGGHAERPAKKLSGGEQQRVALARALTLEPELLLLDEPTANLDPASVAAIEEVIKKIRGESAVVLATNNLFQAGRLSDRVAYLLDGNLIAKGTVEEVLKRPEDARIKRMMEGGFL